MYYNLHSPERQVSLVVKAVDVFTGSAARGVQFMLTELPDQPVVKPDGWHVYYNLPDGEYTICLRGKGFLTETVTVTCGAPPVKVKMFPAAGYSVSAGDTWVEGHITPDTTIFVMPKESGGFRLIRSNGDKLVVFFSSSYNLADGYISCVPGEYIWVDERLDDYTYRVSQPLSGAYGKNGHIYPASIGRSDESGYIFCPIRRFLKEHSEICVQINEKLYTQPAAFGTANSIMLGVE